MYTFNLSTSRAVDLDVHAPNLLPPTLRTPRGKEVDLQLERRKLSISVHLAGLPCKLLTQNSLVAALSECGKLGRHLI